MANITKYIYNNNKLFLLCEKFGIKYEEGTIAFKKKVKLVFGFWVAKIIFFYFYHRFCQILVNHHNSIYCVFVLYY